VKRREVIKRIADEAKTQGKEFFTVELTRHTGIVVDGFRSTLGRHAEIPEQTARSFFKQFEGVLGEGWWRR
jgi:hypothetical protein